MSDEYVTDEGEVIQAGQLATIDNAALATLARVEIDHQIATARQYPRSIQRVTGDILTLATMDEATAEECNYALPRGGKPIQGPSIRLAEIIQQCWGNNRVAARVVHVDRVEKYLEAEGVYHDLQTNSASMARVRRRIVDSKGRLYSDDMIIVTGNAACSIAKRNAILAGVPKSVWRQAYEAARQIVAGDAQTLVARREKAVAAFAHFGVKPEQVFAALGVVGTDDINIDHIPILRGMFAALKNGESTVEEMFSRPTAGPTHQVVSNPLADEDEGGKTGPEKAAGADKASAAPKTADKGTGAPDQASGASGEAAAGKEGKPAPAAADPQEEKRPLGNREAEAAVDAVNEALDQVEGQRANPWFEKGVQAKRDGMSRRAVPPELRSADRADDLDAYRAGYDSGTEAN